MSFFKDQHSYKPHIKFTSFKDHLVNKVSGFPSCLDPKNIIKNNLGSSSDANAYNRNKVERLTKKMDEMRAEIQLRKECQTLASRLVMQNKDHVGSIDPVQNWVDI